METHGSLKIADTINPPIVVQCLSLKSERNTKVSSHLFDFMYVVAILLFNDGDFTLREWRFGASIPYTSHLGRVVKS